MKTKSFPCSVVTIYEMQRGKKLTRGQRSYRPAVTRVMILMTLCTTECCGIYLIDVWPKGAHGLALRSMPYLKTLKDALFHKCFQNTTPPLQTPHTCSHSQKISQDGNFLLYFSDSPSSNLISVTHWPAGFATGKNTKSYLCYWFTDWQTSFF